MKSPFFPTVGTTPLLTRNDVARLLGLTSAAVRKWEQTGKLKADRKTASGTSLFEWKNLAAVLREAIGGGHAPDFLIRRKPGYAGTPKAPKPEVSACFILPAKPTLNVKENEQRVLSAALLSARGNRTHAARIAGVSRRTLHRKLVRWPSLDVQPTV